jgi:hypothetical protein
MIDELVARNTHSVPSLAGGWQRRTAKAGAPHRPLTPKDLGQIKYLRSRLDDVTHCVIGWTVNNWTLFCERAVSDRGLSGSPANPHLGFLVAHYDSAVTIMAEREPDLIAPLLARHKKEREEWLAQDAAELEAEKVGQSHCCSPMLP